METNIDKQKLQIKEKLESLLEQINRSMNEGLETSKLHQIVIDRLEHIIKEDTLEENEQALLQTYVKATNENLQRTEQQLEEINFRADCGKQVLEAIEDDSILQFTTMLLLFIGAERPVIEKSVKA